MEAIPAPVENIVKTVQESSTLEEAAEQIWGCKLAPYSQQLIAKIRERFSPTFQPGAVTDRKEECLNYLYTHGGWVRIRCNSQKADVLEEAVCHRGETLETTRRGVVKLFTKTINQIFFDWGLPYKPTWESIGSIGPDSDIDYSIDIDCTKTRTDKQGACFQQKEYGEIIAKVLFDLLPVYTLKSTSGEIFDAEAYTSPKYQLNIYWKQLVKRIRGEELSPDHRLEMIRYISSSFTLTQIQIVRFLKEPLIYKGIIILTWPLFKSVWRDKRFSLLQLDAEKFAKLTAFKGTKNQITLKRLQDMLKLFKAIKQETDPAKIHLLHLIIKSYYPEAYYTNGAYLHVCYSDQPRSQAFITAAAQKLKQGHSFLTDDDIETIKNKEGLVTMIPFEYAISVVENLAYFLHKLGEGEDSAEDNLFSRLINSSKYLLRIAQGLEGYAQANPDVIDIKNLQKLITFSFQLERLKRGFPPFTSAKDIKSFLNTVFQTLEQPYPQTEMLRHAEELHKIAFEFWARPENKIVKIQEISFPTAKFGIELENNQSGQKWFVVNSALLAAAPENKKTQEKAETASRVALLLNYIAGLETHKNTVMKKATKKEKKQLAKILTIPFAEQGNKTLNDLTTTKSQAAALKAFVNGLIRVVHDVIQDLERKTGNYQRTGLSEQLEYIRDITGAG